MDDGWKNKNGTGDRTCRCGSWKNHWINYSHESWPDKCSVLGCKNEATRGIHVYNSKSAEEFIVPACDSCNKRTDSFALEANISKTKANVAETCG